MKITMDNFKKEVLEEEKTVVLDFYADWCGPCKMQSPILDELSNDEKNIKVVKVNVDEEPDLAEQYNIMSIPTILIFKQGKNTKQFVGLTPKEELVKVCQKITKELGKDESKYRKYLVKAYNDKLNELGA